jgi:hypothetical protein
MERNIYKIGKELFVTSDEEIKEGDYAVQINFEKTNTQIIKCETEFQTKIANDKDGSYTKNKIILTTDPDLIKDGIQAIDDEFLEWFVKNPSCEFVEVITEDVEQPKPLYPNGNHKGERVWIEQYKIIIPQEEPKQETLEDAAERNCESITHPYCDREKSMFIAGAKWQAKRMYSEEEIIKAYYNRNDEIDIDGYWVDDPEKDVKKLIKQLKKEKKLCV